MSAVDWNDVDNKCQIGSLWSFLSIIEGKDYV